MCCIHGYTDNSSGEHVHHRGKVHGPAVEGYASEVGDPDVVLVGRVLNEQQVGIDDLDISHLFPLPAPPAVRLDAKALHDSLNRLFVARECQSNPRRPIRGVLTQHRFNAAFQSPVLLRLCGFVVEGAAGDAERSGPKRPRHCTLGHHLFFWASESLRVISPTRVSSRSFSRLSLRFSERLGPPSAYWAIQPYMVLLSTPCSSATWATETPSCLMRLIICSFTSGAMRWCFFIHLVY